MKNLILSISIACAVSFNNYASSGSLIPSPPKSPALWAYSEDGFWIGKDGYRYALNSGKIWVSKDGGGRRWEAAKVNMWQDKVGNWVKIENNKLLLSKDGKQWKPEPEMKWEGPKGQWYKFDKYWILSTKKVK